MALRNHCNSLSAWHYTGGRNRAVGDLIRDDSGHRIEIWGNRTDGFEPYLVCGGSGVSLSSGRFTLLHHARQACQRQYGIEGGKPLIFPRGRRWL